MLPTLDRDLPAGARRLKQKAAGLKTTIVNGRVLLRNNEHTGALPGQLLRGPMAAPLPPPTAAPIPAPRMPPITAPAAVLLA